MLLCGVGVPFGKALEAQLTEIAHVGFSRRQFELRQMVIAEGKLHVALFCNADRVFQRLGHIGKEGRHLLLALEIEFLRLKAHAVLVLHSLLHLNAHEHILEFALLPAQIVGVVGGRQWQARFLGQPQNPLIDTGLDIQTVVLQFEIIPAWENCRKLQSFGLGCFVVIVEQQLGHLSRHTG